jgi:hypothetical protein
MIKAVVWEGSDGRLNINTMVDRLDETIDIPEKLYNGYEEALRNLFKYEEMIRMFQREQERSRAYADE